MNHSRIFLCFFVAEERWWQPGLRGPLGKIDRHMATLGTELEKAQKTLAEARNLDTSGEGEESEEVFKARLFVEALSTAVQAAHRDTAAAAEAARAELEATREAHAKELEELTMRQGVSPCVCLSQRPS